MTDFILEGARKATPGSLNALRASRAQLDSKLAEIESEGAFPKLAARARVLMSLLEDSAKGEWTSSGFHALAEAVFAIDYLVREVDVIPDSVPVIGLSDDNAVIEAVFKRNAHWLEAYCLSRGIGFRELA